MHRVVAKKIAGDGWTALRRWRRFLRRRGTAGAGAEKGAAYNGRKAVNIGPEQEVVAEEGQQQAWEVPCPFICAGPSRSEYSEGRVELLLMAGDS